MLPHTLQPVAEGQAGGPHNISEKELEERKGGAVTAWLVRNMHKHMPEHGTGLNFDITQLQSSTAAMQEQKIGRERVAVARILQRNGVIVKGGQEQGFKLMDELVVGPGLLPVQSQTIASHL